MAKKREKVKVRKWAKFLPAWAWALGLDALDVVPAAVNTILSFFGVGVVLDWTLDVVQGALALLIFEDARVWAIATGVELVLPAPLDISPTYLALVKPCLKSRPK